jgi:hypothetical protein
MSLLILTTQLLKYLILLLLLSLTTQSAFDKINKVIKNRETLKSREEVEAEQKKQDSEKLNDSHDLSMFDGMNMNTMAETYKRAPKTFEDEEGPRRPEPKKVSVPYIHRNEDVVGKQINKENWDRFMEEEERRKSLFNILGDVLMFLSLISFFYFLCCYRNISNFTMSLWYNQNKHFLKSKYEYVGRSELQKEIAEFNKDEEQLNKIKEKSKECDEITNAFESNFNKND